MISSPVVNDGFAVSLTPRRVYTIARSLLAAVALFTLGCQPPARGTPESARPQMPMAKGPATAPVTIVEFSDYQ